MKILWVKADFLHPTTRGGRIRTREMLCRLHRKHEVHYVGYENPAEPEGLARSAEYCTRAYPVTHRIPDHFSPEFFAQAASGIFTSLPVAVARYRSRAMARQISDLTRTQAFDRFVCDFPNVACNISGFEKWILFQHNIETMIWRRHSQTAPDPLRRWYFRLQADRMFSYERDVARSAAHVIAVSPNDADQMRSLFGIERVSAIPTGVDLDHFHPPAASPKPAPSWDLVFVGAMDWLPNIDGVRYFVGKVLPLIRRRRPACSLAITGRSPTPELMSLARTDPHITVTGTVPDIRPYLWNSRISVVPLRIGGGTRLKVYESMAAKVPVVSTTVGAEGLTVDHPSQIRLADTPEVFADQCVELLENTHDAQCMAENAWQLVSSQFSWDQVTESFEEILARAGFQTGSQTA